MVMPKKSKEEKKKNLSLRLNETLLKKLDEHLKDVNSSRSKLIEDLLKNFLNQK